MHSSQTSEMRVLVACEYSGRVRDAFSSHGHDAMSCDLLPTEVDGPHYQGPVEDVLNDGWDLMPPGPDRWKERSRTFEGVTKAMGEQWGNRLLPAITIQGVLL